MINDNSSRFGKYLEIQFGYFGDVSGVDASASQPAKRRPRSLKRAILCCLAVHQVLGAYLAEYLLEKSRVVRQGDGERNFHVFYYLIAGVDRQDAAKYELQDITDYHYLRGGYKNMSRDTGIDHGECQQEWTRNGSRDSCSMHVQDSSCPLSFSIIWQTRQTCVNSTSIC